MRLKTFISAALMLVLILCATPVYANGIPALPYTLYSTVIINNAPAPVGNLEVSPDESPPLPPEDAHIIGLAYNFEPDGTTLTLTLVDISPMEVAPGETVTITVSVAILVAGKGATR